MIINTIAETVVMTVVSFFWWITSCVKCKNTVENCDHEFTDPKVMSADRCSKTFNLQSCKPERTQWMNWHLFLIASTLLLCAVKPHRPLAHTLLLKLEFTSVQQGRCALHCLSNTLYTNQYLSITCVSNVTYSIFAHFWDQVWGNMLCDFPLMDEIHRLYSKL